MFCILYRQAYVLFKSPQAATAAKQKIESFGEGQQYTKKFIVSYTNPFTNPFRTLPKDGPMRNSNPPSNSRSTPGGFSGSGGMNIPPAPAPFSMNNPSAGYRGNRGGGYNNRGGGMNSMPGYHRGGFQQAIAGGFQGNPMGGFQGNPMGGMSNYGGFQNRGGMMGGMRGGQLGMRGGRGGMNPNGMVGMPMGGMGMGAMGAQMNGMAMGMPQMGVMGMQGMRPSQISSFTNPVGTYAPSIGPTGLQFSPSNSSVLHRSPANPTGRCLSARVGSSAPSPKAGRPHSISSSQGPNWATLTQYSPLAASITPLRSSSQFLASAPPVTPPYTLEQSCLLKHSALRTGQTGFPGAQPHYNPAFFPQQQQGQQGVSGVADGWNPHGAKRTRQE